MTTTFPAVRIGRMDLALSASTPGLTVSELAELCAFGEGLGYRQAWMAEVAGPDAFVLAAAAALRTERMVLGVGVVPAFTRSATTLATAAGSVSQLLGGRRFSLGIGASSERIVSGWHGLAFSRPLTRTVETARAVKAILAGETDYQGRLVSISRFRITSPPLGPVQVFMGALRPGMLAAAGAVADGVCLNLMPPEVVSRQLAEVRRGAEEVGRALGHDFGVMARLQVLITDDPASARERLRNEMFGPYLAQPVYNRFLAWMGYAEEAEAIAAGWAARDREAVARAIHDRLVDALALIGSAARVREGLERFAAAGITVAALSVLTPSRTAVEDTLRALAA
jgi:probable F420-dependent oxidoreductase